MAVVPEGRLAIGSTSSASVELASSKTLIVQTSSLLALAPELRNHIYACLFPCNTRFETTQQTSANDRYPRWKGYRVKFKSHFRHPVTIGGIETKYLLGILGTCQSIREEATDFLRQDLRGKFTVMIQTNFLRIPRAILELVDTVEYDCRIWSGVRMRHNIHFPNLVRLIEDIMIFDKNTLIRDLKSLGGSGYPDDPTTHITLLRDYFENLDRHDLNSWDYHLRRPLERARANIPDDWILLYGRCPVAIIVQICVLDFA